MSQRLQRIGSGLRKNICVLRRSKSSDHSENCERESEVTNTICYESLARSIGCFLPIKVITDKQVRTETNAFPPHEHHQEIRAHDQHEHRKHEEAHVSKETVEARVAMHVTGGKDENAEPDASHNEHEDR